MTDVSPSACAVVAKDADFIRTVLSRPVSPGTEDLLAIAEALDRMLAGGGLARAAAERGRPAVALRAPDNRPIYRAERSVAYRYFQSAGARVFGMWIRAIMVEAGARPREIEGMDGVRTVEMSVEAFLAQKVIDFGGLWVSRADMLRAVKDLLSGREPTDEAGRLLVRVRRSVRLTLLSDQLAVEFDADNYRPDPWVMRWDRDGVDPLMLEFIAAVAFVLSSPSVQALERPR